MLMASMNPYRGKPTDRSQSVPTCSPSRPFPTPPSSLPKELSASAKESLAPSKASSVPSQESYAAPGDSSSFWQIKGRKRSRDPEDERCGKRQRTHLGPTPECSLSLAYGSSQPLNADNLRELNRIHEMERDAEALARPLKRTRSRQSITETSDSNQESTSVRSRKPSIPPAIYRWGVLDNARAYLRWGSPPEEILDYIKDVIKREPPKETTPEEREAYEGKLVAKKARLFPIVEGLMRGFIDVFAGPLREDHSVEPLYTALSLMDPDAKLGFLRKADWETSLKPHEGGDFTMRPGKRQQAEMPASSAMLPPPPKEDFSFVKTPRPDITAGLRHDTVVQALVRRGWTKLKADRTLKSLQERRILISDPTQVGVIRFPDLVVESKAYATGTQVFEAENQALVSGACMINLQQQCANLADRASSESPRRKIPAIGFSICNEGPFIQLGVNSTTVEEGTREFDMHIYKSCHISVPDEVLDFLMVVDDVLSWTRGVYLDDIVDQIILLDSV